MFGYVITIVLTIFIVSIITEHMVIQRLQMSPGVAITNGRCRLQEGYGKLTPQPSAEQLQAMNMPRRHRTEVHDDFYRPFVD